MPTPAVRRAADILWNEFRHAALAISAGTRLCILSRRACSCHSLAHFLHQNDIFCAFSVQNRQGTDRNRILLRESMPLSCHEKREKIFKVRPIRPKQAFRYPIDTLPIPDFRKIRSQIATHLVAPGPLLDRTGPFLAHLRAATHKETDATTDSDPLFDTRRRSDPQRGPLLAQKAGCLHPCRRQIRGQNPCSATDETGGHLPVL